jgi:hypothetical protein
MPSDLGTRRRQDHEGVCAADTTFKHRRRQRSRPRPRSGGAGPRRHRYKGNASVPLHLELQASRATRRPPPCSATERRRSHAFARGTGRRRAAELRSSRTSTARTSSGRGAATSTSMLGVRDHGSRSRTRRAVGWLRFPRWNALVSALDQEVPGARGVAPRTRGRRRAISQQALVTADYPPRLHV